MPRKKSRKGIQGRWQRESPAREYFEQVKWCKDTDCTSKMMKLALLAGKEGELGIIQKYLQSPSKSHEMGF